MAEHQFKCTSLVWLVITRKKSWNRDVNKSQRFLKTRNTYLEEFGSLARLQRFQRFLNFKESQMRLRDSKTIYEVAWNILLRHCSEVAWFTAVLLAWKKGPASVTYLKMLEKIFSKKSSLIKEAPCLNTVQKKCIKNISTSHVKYFFLCLGNIGAMSSYK